MSFDTSTMNTRGDEIVDWLQKEFAAIRTGQAAPELLDSVRVDSYGAKVPLNQIGSVGVEDARTLRISVWDSGSVHDVERAIADADLGLSVTVDGSSIRVIFPELTGERREQLAKLAKKKLEDARVSVRSMRDDVMKAAEKAEKDGELSEDEKFRVKETVQKKVDELNDALETLYKSKEASITAI